MQEASHEVSDMGMQREESLGLAIYSDECFSKASVDNMDFLR